MLRTLESTSHLCVWNLFSWLMPLDRRSDMWLVSLLNHKTEIRYPAKLPRYDISVHQRYHNVQTNKPKLIWKDALHRSEYLSMSENDWYKRTGRQTGRQTGGGSISPNTIIYIIIWHYRNIHLYPITMYNNRLKIIFSDAISKPRHNIYNYSQSNSNKWPA